MPLPNNVLTVSQLNRNIRLYLEGEIGPLQVEGEVSNLSKPSSGHYYFTLKDATAQIRCVFFKNRHANFVKGSFADGQRVVAHGRLSLYEARGDYQLIVESMTDAGSGALHLAFEALKQKLQLEGLFDVKYKKPLPPYPKTIGIISSKTGAALQDILSTLARRFPLAKVLIYPSEVQGLNAPQQLIQALTKAKQDGLSDVLIIARGGGSLEDLWAFNNETLARAIFSCPIPIVSGVGHEIDFTIADFVADYRAETPTAAAEAVTPNVVELLASLNDVIYRLTHALEKLTKNKGTLLKHLTEKITSPQTLILHHWQALDNFDHRLHRAMHNILGKNTQIAEILMTKLQANSPKLRLQEVQRRLQEEIPHLLNHHMLTLIRTYKQMLYAKMNTMHAISPLATLERGYAIATLDKQILFTTKQVRVGECIDVRLSQGQLTCEVTKKKG